MAKNNCQEIRMKNRITVEDTDRVIIKSKSDQNISYKIKSLIVHQGSSTKSGHYEAWVRDKNNKGWFKISDSSFVKRRELISLDSAYLIFLEKND